MRAFCPSCDAEVVPEGGVAPRCPGCHRRLDPDDLLGARPEPGGWRRPLAFALGALILVAAGAGGWWTLEVRGGGASSPEAGEDAGAKRAVDWHARLAAAGLGGARAKPPDEADASLTAAAKGAGELGAWLGGLTGPGRLQPLPRGRRRRHPVRTAAELYRDVVAAKARPAHPIEVAWLSLAACRAAGVKAHLVVDRGGVQTPLLLARTRVAVRTDGGQLLDPLGQTLLDPRPVEPARVAAWWLVIRAHAERSAARFKAAHADLTAAARLVPDDPAIAFARGVLALDQGLLDAGLARCEAALARHEDALARLFLVDVLSAMQRPFKAWGHLEKALKTKPVLPEAWVSKGLVEAGRVATSPEADKAARMREAEQAFRKALALDPAVPGARAGLAQVLYMKKDEAGAEELLREAVSEHADADAALLLTELLLPAGKAEEAAKLLDGLGRDDDERIVQALARALVAKGDKEAALKVAERAHDAFPENRDNALLRADLLRQLGRLPEAIAAMEPLRQGSDGDRMTMLQAQMYLQTGEADRAVANLEPIVKASSSNREAVTLLLLACLKAGKGIEADAVAARALAEGTLGHVQLAGVFLQSSDTARATATLESAVALDRPPPEAAAMLAMIYTASGRKAAALKLRQRLVAKAGDAGEELGKQIDEAIAGAEAEMAAMQREERSAGATPAGEGPPGGGASQHEAAPSGQGAGGDEGAAPRGDPSAASPAGAG